jgi:PucR family transcriptional regulator, purine catabolism regulatory protein
VLPTVADVLALEPVKLGSPRVVAGADGLGAPVRWVHVIELAEAGRLLRGGELVLSTGIALPPDPDGLTRYVAGLAAAGVSALAVELGSRYLRALPEALVTAAGSHGLPLIVLERETQFVAITEAVHARILDAQGAELRAAKRLHEVFTGLALAGATQDEIVRQASDLAGAAAILADLSHRVLACAPARLEMTQLLAGFAARSRSAAISGRTGYDRAAGWLVAMVGSRGADWARLIFVLPGPPDPGTLVLAEQAATTLALARLVTERQQESPERAAHRSLLAALAGPGYADPADLEARIVALGVPLAGRVLIPVVITVPGGENAPRAVADAVAAACQDLRLPAIAATLDDSQAGALLALAAGADQDRALTRLAARLRRAGALAGSQLIGAGPAVASVAKLPRAFGDAASAAAAAAGESRRWPARSRPFARLSDLRLAGLLYQLREDRRVQEFAERELGALLSHDERTGADLVAVLATYLETGGNKAETAKRRGLARPTLYERLRQIEQVLGASLDESGSRLALHAALLIRSAGSNLAG